MNGTGTTAVAVLMVVAVIGSFATAILVGMLADANRAANMWHRRALSLEEENDDLRHRLVDLTSAAAYSCGRCGARFGIAGASTGSPEDIEAERLHRADVEWHESGLCQVQPHRPPWAQLRTLRGGR